MQNLALTLDLHLQGNPYKVTHTVGLGWAGLGWAGLGWGTRLVVVTVWSVPQHEAMVIMINACWWSPNGIYTR